MTQPNSKSPTLIKVALYEPDIPQNTAAIVRLCACFGVRLDIIEPCGFFLSDKRFKRVVMDYILECKIKSFKDFTEFKKDKENKRIILMTTKAKRKYFDFKFNQNDTGSFSCCFIALTHTIYYFSSLTSKKYIIHNS